MNVIMQEQRNTRQQIAGIIWNFRKVTTRTGKAMAVFMVGTIPAKCFDLTVDQAERWAQTGKQVSITGQFSYHNGQVELVAQDIALAAPGQIAALAEIAASNQASNRESSMVVENLSGCGSDVRTVTTRSGRLMVTFRIGSTPCKAFGDLAAAIQKAEGKQIEVSARKGRFRGEIEYAVEIVKTIGGTAVDLRDTRTIAPEEHISKTSHTSEGRNLTTGTDSNSLELSLQSEFGSGPHSSEGMVTMLDLLPPVNPGQDSSREEQRGSSSSAFEDSSQQCTQDIVLLDSFTNTETQQEAVIENDNRFVDAEPTLAKSSSVNSDLANGQSVEQGPSHRLTSRIIGPPIQPVSSKSQVSEYEMQLASWMKRQTFYTIADLERFSTLDNPSGEAARRLLARRREMVAEEAVA